MDSRPLWACWFEKEMSPTGLDIWIVGSQLVALFGEAWIDSLAVGNSPLGAGFQITKLLSTSVPSPCCPFAIVDENSQLPTPATTLDAACPASLMRWIPSLWNHSLHKFFLLLAALDVVLYHSNNAPGHCAKPCPRNKGREQKRIARMACRSHL